ncbi:hypothetical protein HBH98_112530 [Parastagonospora nodorum]|nr:hypothetical protein HBH53_134600 [Parastagonospora nodorum]KAH4216157.1 hypothetical protein HBI06_235350 [Parastagonospora nodorum]KAH4226411.1 hypothetical protein HBI05_221530 [Parastagonospora nodorum]KAH4306009.1 hypothetical protein HBI01_057380 [Parastagonospora nodorum]KAH4310575.1 hypothetical protein HBI02_099720 [Parastagonospora nodorum]
MAPKEAALHTQDLIDIMVELDHWKFEPRFAKALKMANRGTLYQLNEQDLEDHRGGIFGKEIWDSPILSGKNNIPLTSLPTPAQTQRIMMLEIGGDNEYTFAPSHGSSDLDVHATKVLLENMLNPTYASRGAIIHAACPTLDRLRKDTSASQNDGVLGQTDFQVSIAPACEFFDVKVYDNRRYITLLSGKQVIIAYPPSVENSTMLTARYKALARSASGAIWDAVDLQYGIAIVQKSGETLVLPPFWSCVVLCTEMCVSAAYSIATASQYTHRFKHIAISITQLQMWPDPRTQQIELMKLASSLAHHLGLSINSHLPCFDNRAVVTDICKKWEGEMKAKFGQLLGMIDDEAECDRICGIVTQAWIQLVHARRDKKPVCRLCKERLDRVKGLPGPDQHLIDHVVDTHCAVRMRE